jgi:transposase-like protein
VVALHEKVHAGASKAAVAREFGISRETLYTYLRKPLPDAAGREDMQRRQRLEKNGQAKLI